ncbi:MAG: hypothetical protein OIF35_00880 [Cellvibrionaceae bacterium]|nr:hypothetical protein [Cellvibrionaceae bacterium]
MHTANNLAGAQHHASLSTQMNAAIRKYSTLIAAERDRIKSHEERLKDLKKSRQQRQITEPRRQ